MTEAPLTTTSRPLANGNGQPATQWNMEFREAALRCALMKKSALLLLLFMSALTLIAATKPAPKPALVETKPALDASMLKGMQWREVGPYRGGRADGVEGIVGDRNTYYFASS